jgi:four helix bundle protein
MASEGYVPIEQMELFRRFVTVADWVWETVSSWPVLAQDTVGKQLIRAADSVGANLVEGDGRYSDAEGVRFFVIARASAREARYWLERAIARRLIPRETADEQVAILISATQLLNRLIAARRRAAGTNKLREPQPVYQLNGDDLLTEHLNA